jgi:hypothetical protein
LYILALGILGIRANQITVYHRVLSVATAGAMDRFRVPRILEWPQVLLCWFLVVGALILHGLISAAHWVGVIQPLRAEDEDWEEGLCV